MQEIARKMPASLESERYVLGAAMLDSEARSSMLQILGAEDFFSDMHREIFMAIKSLDTASKPVDSLLVCEELKSRQVLTQIGGRAAVLEMTADIPSAQNAEQYARIVAEKSMLRKMIKTAKSIADEGFAAAKDAKDIIDEAERKIFEIAQKGQTREYESIVDVLTENLRLIALAEKNKGKITGVPSGFTDLDKITWGFQKANLVIIAARPAMGKTAFALNIAKGAAAQGKSVLIFNLEMKATDLGNRLLSIQTRVDSDSLKKGNLNQEKWKQIHSGIHELSLLRIHIDETPAISVFEMKNKCRRLKAQEGLDLVIIDYLQLMDLGGRIENRQQEISKLSRMLKLMAMELDVPVILLSQLNRAADSRSDHRPMLADLRESGSIEQDADMVILLYRDEYYNSESEEPGVAEVIIAKHRNGPTGTVKLGWIGDYTRFMNLDIEK